LGEKAAMRAAKQDISGHHRVRERYGMATIIKTMLARRYALVHTKKKASAKRYVQKALKGGMDTDAEERVERVQQAFENARKGDGLFGLKNAE
jgi:hypothetical protein